MKNYIKINESPDYIDLEKFTKDGNSNINYYEDVVNSNIETFDEKKLKYDIDERVVFGFQNDELYLEFNRSHSDMWKYNINARNFEQRGRITINQDICGIIQVEYGQMII